VWPFVTGRGPVELFEGFVSAGHTPKIRNPKTKDPAREERGLLLGTYKFRCWGGGGSVGTRGVSIAILIQEMQTKSDMGFSF